MRAIATAALVFAGVLAASGCAGSGARPQAHTPSTTGGASQPVAQRSSHGGAGPLVVPIGATAMHNLKLHLYSARFLSPTRLAIPGIVGSSNCPSVPDKLVVRSPHAIRVDLVVGSWTRTASGLRLRVPHSPGLCLDDLVPVPVVLAIDPQRIALHHRVKVSLYYPEGTIRRYRRPVVFTVPPLATARIRQEVRVARDSNPRLFSIFPAVPGKKLCVIPDGARSPTSDGGVCQTAVRGRRTMEPSVAVVFTESWWPHCPPMVACSPRALRHHSWRVIEGETIVTPGAKLHVYATRSRGARPPQLRN